MNRHASLIRVLFKEHNWERVETCDEVKVARDYVAEHHLEDALRNILERLRQKHSFDSITDWEVFRDCEADTQEEADWANRHVNRLYRVAFLYRFLKEILTERLPF